MTALATIPQEDGPLVALDLEQQVLGGILANNKVFERVQAFLQPEHFADARHAEIYECIKAMLESGKPATPPMLSTYMGATDALQKIGGNAYLARIVAGTVSVALTEDYARALLDLWARRQAVRVIDDARDRLKRADLSDPAAAQLSQAASALDELAVHGTTAQSVSIGSAATDVVNAVAEIVEDGVVPELVPTGFRDLDRLIGGLERGEMMILGARPSQGKTGLAQWIAYNAASAGYPVAFFSLEMQAMALTRRWVSGLSRVSAIAMKTGEVWERRYGQQTKRRLSSDEMTRIREAAASIDKLPLHIDARPALTTAEIVAGVRKLNREKKNIQLVVIDYLGLARSNDKARSEYEMITAISRELKAAAKTLNLPFIVLSQLSRANESRDDKRPQLSDLRSSGAIEQDGDIIAFLHREHYYLARAIPKQGSTENEGEFRMREAEWQDQCRKFKGRAEIIIAKSRNGAVDTIEIAFEDEITRFRDLEETRDERGDE